jgi:probable HAF family extracellular repeat protein
MATMKRKSFLIIGLCVVAVVALAVSAALLARKPPVRYRLTVLPTLGGFRTDPHSINDRGQVVGVSETPTGAVYAFLWDRQQGFRTLERFDDPPHAGGLVINNLGQVIGTAADPNGNQRAYFLDPNAGRQLLGALGGKQSSADGLNNRGQVVGSAEVPARYRHAYVWDAVRGMQDLGTLGGFSSAAVSINDSGQIVGFAETSARHTHVVLWEPNPPEGASPVTYRKTDLGDAGVGPLACEINHRGLVMRRLGTTAGKTYFVTWTRATGSQTLGFVADSAFPIGLNEKNQFLIRAKPTGLRLFGRVFNRHYQGYLWDPNEGVIPLESRMPVKDIRHLTVRETNNNGQIIVSLQTGDSDQIRAVLLEEEQGERRK